MIINVLQTKILTFKKMKTVMKVRATEMSFYRSKIIKILKEIKNKIFFFFIKKIFNLYKTYKRRKVFDRLFDDFTEREDRLEELKAHLEKLEAMHWEEIPDFYILFEKYFDLY